MLLNKRTKQMYAEGGMMQDGGTVDPVSGNEVPVGSLQEEVRDDIPAKLSEGEFVVPADVVRYIGLEKLMKMRDAAKEGLERMEDVGQMGNADTAPAADEDFDDGFDTEIDDIIGEVDGELQMAKGGFVSGEDLSKAPKNTAVDVRYYKHPDGRVMFITFINNRPMTAIPEGFTQTEGPVEQKVGKAAEERDAAVGVAGGGDGGGDRIDTTEGGRTVSSGMLDPTKPFEGDAFKMSPTGKQTAKALGLTALGVLAGNPLLGAKAIYDAIVKPKSKNVSGVSEGYVNHIEQQANAVSSGQYDISGSPFGSVGEAKAISQYGFMSNEHMDAVERSMESQLASSGKGGPLDFSGAANTGMSTTPGGKNVSGYFSTTAQDLQQFGVTSAQLDAERNDRIADDARLAEQTRQEDAARAEAASNYSGGGDYSGGGGDSGGGQAAEAAAASEATGGTGTGFGDDGSFGDSDSSSGDGGGGGGKIVCTAMNQAYGFGGFRNKIWLAYAAKNLTKAHEVGYHALFLPLVAVGYNQGDKMHNRIVRRVLENIARHRSADLRAEMRGTKRDPVGRAYRLILEPLCYVVGKYKLSKK